MGSMCRRICDRFHIGSIVGIPECIVLIIVTLPDSSDIVMSAQVEMRGRGAAKAINQNKTRNLLKKFSRTV